MKLQSNSETSSLQTNEWLDGRDVQKVLTDLGMMPNRRYGQSFLIDRRMACRMVDGLELGPEDVLLEIGPGLGALTSLMTSRVKKLLAIEVDSKLEAYLRKRFFHFPQVEIVHKDFLESDIEGILKSLSAQVCSPGSVKVMGNLPYRISTQILFKLLECPLHPNKMVLAFQWEVAERLTASPGTKDYGAMTLIIQYYGQAKKLVKIGKNSFYPKPEVDTGVLMFSFVEPNFGLPPGAEKALFDLIKCGFAQRRKTLKNALTNSRILPYTVEQIDEAMSLAQMSPKVRAETLVLSDFARLFKNLELLKLQKTK